MIRDEVGATEQSGRLIMAWAIVLAFNRLLLSWWVSVILKLVREVIRDGFHGWYQMYHSKAKGPDSYHPDALSFRRLIIVYE